MERKITEENLYKSLFDFYDKFTESNLKPCLIKHQQVVALISSLEKENSFTIEKLGESVERRAIYSVKFGTGPVKILAWSQMHGDEPTATAALFDLIRFFHPNELFEKFRKNLLSKITFHFIPMVNPDGAEKFQRENTFNVDLNRDALRRESDESRILWSYAEKIQPEFGFNLHDQNSYYASGLSNNPAAVSLLAPAMNHVKSVDNVRERSMQVISKIAEMLFQFIPNNIARYKDDFEPRAFGDNFVKNGISTILIESGFSKGDPDKNFIRKLNFVALLSAFNTIAENNFDRIDYRKYFDIPENHELFMDLILRNLSLNVDGRKFRIDIGIKREKQLNRQTGEFFFKGTIAEIGDLSTFYGFEEKDLSGCEVASSKILAADDPADFSISKDGKVELKILNGFITKREH